MSTQLLTQDFVVGIGKNNRRVHDVEHGSARGLNPHAGEVAVPLMKMITEARSQRHSKEKDGLNYVP